jgi:hypothetical protein
LLSFAETIDADYIITGDKDLLDNPLLARKYNRALIRRCGISTMPHLLSSSISGQLYCPPFVHLYPPTASVNQRLSQVFPA